VQPAAIEQPESATSPDDVLRRVGVTVNTTAGVTRIDIPPVPSIRHLRVHVVWIVILGVIVLLASIATISTPPIVVAAVEYGVILALVVGHVAHRLRRRLLFEIDDDSVNLFNVVCGKAKQTRSWPRRDVSETRILMNGRLWIRAHHQQVAEIYLTPWRDVNEAIAAELRGAIAASHADATEKPALWYASTTLSETKAPGRGKRVLLIVAVVLSVGGFAAFIVGAWWVSLIFFMLAAAPAGMALGTQERDFYL